MAKIKQKTFDTAQRAIHFQLEDDFGHVHHLTVHLAKDRCSHCSREYPKTEEGFPDTTALVKQVMQELDEEFDRLLSHFEREGADTAAHKARRDANRNPQGNTGRRPDAEGVDRAGG